MGEHLTTDQKGEIAVLKVREEALRKGAFVSIPTIPVRYDLVLDYQGRLYRAQVKYAESKSPRSQGAVRLDLRRRKRCYTQDEIDLLLVYLPQLDRLAWFGPEFFHGRQALFLRICPTKNGQRRGCLMVDGFLW